jgi:hypothetical protein
VTLPRFRIGALMAVIALAALDFAAIRALRDFDSPKTSFNILAVGGFAY